jgi:hypothetical protein
MDRWMARIVVLGLVGAGVVAGAFVASAEAQTMARVRGEVSDEWGNAIEGAQVIGRREGADPRTTDTNDDGRFNLTNLPSGDYVLEFHADGYTPTGVAMYLDQRDARQPQRPLEIELVASPPGSRLRDDVEFESADGRLKLELKGDGKFEFEDADGEEGEGTYGIVELEAQLTVRDYDGDDDKYSISQPVVLTFDNNLFRGLTWDGVALSQK